MNALTDEQINRTLRLMQHKAGEMISEPVAREICQRNGLKAMVSGSIAQSGDRYIFHLEASNCATGEALARAGADGRAGSRFRI